MSDMHYQLSSPSPPDRRRLSRLVTFGSHALVSLLAAITFASAIVMLMFARTAVIAKMTSKTPSYDRVLQARRQQAALHAAMVEEDAAAAVELRRDGRAATAKAHQTGLDAWMRVAQ